MRRDDPAHFLLILCSQTPRKAALRGDFSAQLLCEAAFYHLAHLTLLTHLTNNKNNNKNKSNNKNNNNKITNAQSADADHGRLTAPCAAAAAPVRALLLGNVRSFSGKAKQT